MTLKRGVVLLAAMVFILGAAGTVMAEGNRAGAFNITPFAGYYVFEGDQHMDNSLTYGLGLGYNITDNWGVELVYNRFDTESDRGLGDATGNIFHLDALYHFMPSNRFVPYVALGGGYSDIEYDWQSDDEDLNANWGIGFKYFFNPTVALRVDARHIYQFGDPEQNLAVYGGLTFQLGGKKKMAPPPPPCPDEDNDGVCDDVDKCPGTPPSIVVDETGCGKIEKEIRFEIKVLFDFDKSNIKPEFHDVLREAADFMKQYPNTTARIEGNTDSIGTEAYNQKLSERRARSVMEYLIQNFGLPADRMTAIGYGESNPVASNDTAEGRARNRRVEAVLNAIKITVE